ncbi:MAG: hypothetical protein LBS16_07205 [Prevotellaceae bacterium]|jgi:hypothetical protein|nr:hypothetical protein [Prevotellaceae bacterium]
MKIRFSFLLALMLTATSQLWSQNQSVYAFGSDISDNLDLRAVSVLFGRAHNIETFEEMLNNRNNRISNLDLNNDGFVDYLRVVEATDNGVRLVIIQAVLSPDIYQDVATIVIERSHYNPPYVQIIGDPYLYGYNYVIEPYYATTPFIYDWLWSVSYRPWYSPYRWGYYPRHYASYRYVNPRRYYSRMTDFHRQYHCTYHYPSSPRFSYHDTHSYKNASRSDYATRYPDRSFGTRHPSSQSSSVRNARDIQERRDNSTRRSDATPPRTESPNRSSTGTRPSNNATERSSAVERGNSRTSRESTTPQQTTPPRSTKETKQTTPASETRTSPKSTTSQQAIPPSSMKETKQTTPASETRTVPRSTTSQQATPSSSTKETKQTTPASETRTSGSTHSQGNVSGGRSSGTGSGTSSSGSSGSSSTRTTEKRKSTSR